MLELRVRVGIASGLRAAGEAYVAVRELMLEN